MDNFSVDAGYNNTFYDYDQDATDIAGPPLNGIGSRSATLDRIEHDFYAHGNYQVLPKTTISLGYRFDLVDYTSSDAFFQDTLGQKWTGSARDNRSHIVTLGVKQHIN